VAQRRNLFTPAAAPDQASDVPPPPSPGAPFVGGFANYIPPPMVPPFGWGYPYMGGNTVGGALQGLSNLTVANSIYYQNIQQARMAREQSRQLALDTRRRQIEFEMWYETVRPTAPGLLRQEQQTDLDWARNHAQNTEIWSGRALNVLLRSILRSPHPTGGPHIPLDENQLRGLNLTDGTTRANLSLARDDGKIDWPEALAAEPFDKVRAQFSKNFSAAVREAQSSGPPTRDVLIDLRADLQKMDEKLVDQVSDLAPSRFIESRRLLNQLRDNVQGLGDARVVQASRGDWRKEVRSVSDLVGYLMKNGLQFGPAVRGGETSYTSTYFALRRYEMALAYAQP
jgi:hypothetical protein